MFMLFFMSTTVYPVVVLVHGESKKLNKEFCSMIKDYAEESRLGPVVSNFGWTGKRKNIIGAGRNLRLFIGDEIRKVDQRNSLLVRKEQLIVIAFDIGGWVASRAIQQVHQELRGGTQGKQIAVFCTIDTPIQGDLIYLNRYSPRLDTIAQCVGLYINLFAQGVSDDGKTDGVYTFFANQRLQNPIEDTMVNVNVLHKPEGCFCSKPVSIPLDEIDGRQLAICLFEVFNQMREQLYPDGLLLVKRDGMEYCREQIKHGSSPAQRKPAFYRQGGDMKKLLLIAVLASIHMSAHPVVYLVHGAFQSVAQHLGVTWYKPGGDFYEIVSKQTAEIDAAIRAEDANLKTFGEVVSFDWVQIPVIGGSGAIPFEIKEGAEKLAALIKVKRSLIPESEQVVVIAHSNGGLVSAVAAQLLLKEFGKPMIDRLYTLGTPLLGDKIYFRDDYVPQCENIGQCVGLYVNLFGDFDPLNGAITDGDKVQELAGNQRISNESPDNMINLRIQREVLTEREEVALGRLRRLFSCLSPCSSPRITREICYLDLNHFEITNEMIARNILFLPGCGEKEFHHKNGLLLLLRSGGYAYMNELNPPEEFVGAKPFDILPNFGE